MKYFDINSHNFEVTKGEPFYCQKNFNADGFEKEYLKIREKEDRIYHDSLIQDLPRIYLDHPLYHEWKIRGRSAYRLVKKLKKEKPKLVVEVGCGNGWLTNVLQGELRVPVVGVDIVKAELAQGANLFWGWAHFVYGDILSDAFQDLKPDAIVLAASAQYFPDLRLLITRLRSMLTDNGSIHIIDTPFYKKGTASDARARSADYFRTQGAGEMEQFYFHHEIDILKEFNAKFLYRPNLINRVLNKSNSPFPWVRIRKDPSPSLQSR